MNELMQVVNDNEIFDEKFEFPCESDKMYMAHRGRSREGTSENSDKKPETDTIQL